MSNLKSYKVLRQLDGDRFYAPGETRQMSPADAMHLVASGALELISEAKSEPASLNRAEGAPLNKAEPAPVNKAGTEGATGQVETQDVAGVDAAAGVGLVSSEAVPGDESAGAGKRGRKAKG